MLTECASGTPECKLVIMEYRLKVTEKLKKKVELTGFPKEAISVKTSETA